MKKGQNYAYNNKNKFQKKYIELNLNKISTDAS